MTESSIIFLGNSHNIFTCYTLTLTAYHKSGFFDPLNC